ncbi:Papilin, partial [Araneus ventricosus]
LLRRTSGGINKGFEFAALRNAAGVFYLNANWRIEFPREVKIAGTIFQYERRQRNTPEVLRARGPIIEPIYVVLLYQEKNLGISYEYSIPATTKVPQPDSYEWMIGNYEECSQSCGGGLQIRIVSCIRKSDGDIVVEELCDSLLKPAVNASCNTEPCPPGWHIGEWSACSQSCGGGAQFRLVFCHLLKEGNIVMIPDEMCEGPKSVFMRVCNIETPCHEWVPGEWSECDRTCGNGSRTRTVECPWQGETLASSLCDADKKPVEFESCTLGPCEEVKWTVSEWSGWNRLGLSSGCKEDATALNNQTFHLFGPLKQHLGGKHFADDDDVQHEVLLWMRQQPKEFYAAEIGALIKRWDKCINIGGDYAEK